ncbi:SGNH/GDSL hydrolase family protein [Piscinibacter koreensis]|uniref:SGNH/GDSL hydrolase family protein n=1 Tax=Piscinibacter koreensis TaxID=2742824 RepID=A0A7Y6TXF2_9BURK|nr:SGNH/GDSL hydrolase family protein [Schlegelella koreensis]NUZ07084.1 SGNH/GDSL hydrolase family protein [Schlegelella koreensis]
MKLESVPTRPEAGDPSAGSGGRLGRRSFMVGVPAAAAGLALAPSAFAISRQDLNASASWAAAPVSAAPAADNQINNQTIRQVVHLSVGGDSLRVKLSNRYGTSTLVVSAATIGVSAGNENAQAGSARTLTFNGRTFFTIPAFGELYSDWIGWNVPSQSDLVIDVYIASNTSSGTSPLTLHNARPAGQVLSYLANGNVAGTPTFPTVASRTAWYFLTGVDVSNSRSPGSVCCFGDSITDGSWSTIGANARYPDYLAQRLLAASPSAPMGVVNLGIGGNRVLATGTGDSALARFDRDVLAQTGVYNIVVLEGINDISGGATAPRIIDGHRQLIRRAHSKGKKIYGATLTPYGNAPEAREAERQAVNAWIRSSGEYDAVIDFDAAVRDPANPRVMLAMYDSGDTLHPNSAGYAAMANAVPLSLFAGPRPRLL